MVLIICTKNELNLTNRYWDMVPDRQKVRTDGTDGQTDGRRQNYIPPTSSGDNKEKGSWLIESELKTISSFHGFEFITSSELHFTIQIFKR